MSHLGYISIETCGLGVPDISESSGNLLALPGHSSLPSDRWDSDISMLCGGLSKYHIFEHLHWPNHAQIAKSFSRHHIMGEDHSWGSMSAGTLLWMAVTSAARFYYPSCLETFRACDTGTLWMLFISCLISLSTCGRKFCYFKCMLSKTFQAKWFFIFLYPMRQKTVNKVFVVMLSIHVCGRNTITRCIFCNNCFSHLSSISWN